jgi:hypothetical protein
MARGGENKAGRIAASGDRAAHKRSQSALSPPSGEHPLRKHASYRVKYDYSGGKGAWFYYEGDTPGLLTILSDIARNFDIYQLELDAICWRAAPEEVT